VTEHDLRRRAFDHRTGFLLSLVDGKTPAMGVENLLDLSAMPEEETLALLGHLLQQGIVALR
jgi:hypothetical protein